MTENNSNNLLEVLLDADEQKYRDKLKAIMVYFCDRFNEKKALDKARLTKMVYLADWETAQKHGEQLTNIKWYYNHYGPFVYDVVNLAYAEPALFEVNPKNKFGIKKDLIQLKQPQATDKVNAIICTLPSDERKLLEDIIKRTKDKQWKEFIGIIYTTYPIRKHDKYDELDLVELAAEYKRKKKTFISFL